ncbi:hypothetical protein SAY86_004985 [Trapa natans]|uniref:ATG1a/b/c MIT domain-containing protein n=1 Tax=Trapa natans TaxID=22666 RepID=A0AAN7QS21_TRANT|nr:hypothetical protein SAY86_004985 [Trapa natans]
MVHFTEMAIKEIATGRLSKKLLESLMSEIVILQKINHLNIIRLHEIIEIGAGKHLEAFSIQLVILAVWKQALHTCHAQAASDMEGSPSHGASRRRRSSNKNDGGWDSAECSDAVGNMRPEDVSGQIEVEFLQEVEKAEQFAKSYGSIFSVDELMGDPETAVSLYSKAVCLLVFLLVEAPSLILNPRFSPTSSDRYRLQNYIEILNGRQGQMRLILKPNNQQCPTSYSLLSSCCCWVKYRSFNVYS